MIIILEGLDRCGKSTQSNLIIKRMKDYGTFHKLHYSSLPFKNKDTHIKYSKSLYDSMFNMMISLIDSHNLIFDRSHLGESVYSPLYRGYDGDFIFDIENKYIDQINEQIYLITLINDPKVIYDRNDGLSFHTNEQDIINETNGFIRAHNLSKITNKILLNVGNMNPNEVSDVIVDFLTKHTIQFK